MAWLMGYLGLASWRKVLILSVPLLFCLGYFYAHKNELNIILSGDEEAKNLGVDAPKLKRYLLESHLADSLVLWDSSCHIS